MLTPEIAILPICGHGMTLMRRPGEVDPVMTEKDDDGITRMNWVGMFINMPGNQEGTWLVEAGHERYALHWEDADWTVEDLTPAIAEDPPLEEDPEE